MKINFLKYNSFLVSFYIFYHDLPRIFQILKINESYCKYLLILSLFFIVFEIKNLNIKFIKIIFAFTILILINLLFTQATVEEISYHMKDIYFYGISAAIVGSLKINKKEIIKYIKIFSYINIFIYSYVIIFAKDIYYEKMDYMTYGYCMLQSLVFLIYFLAKREKNFYINFILSIYSLMMIILFGNRFAVLIGISSTIIFYWYYERRKLKKIIVYFILFLGSLITYLNINNILMFIYNLFMKLNYNAQGIARLIKSLQLSEQGLDITSGRSEIYLEAIEIIKNNPLGIGIWGYLSEVKYGIKILGYKLGYYPHNVFIEIGMHLGVIGIVCFIIIILKVGYEMIILKNDSYKLFLIALIILNFKLLLSDTYISYNMFWIFWAVYFNETYK